MILPGTGGAGSRPSIRGLNVAVSVNDFRKGYLYVESLIRDWMRRDEHKQKRGQLQAAVEELGAPARVARLSVGVAEGRNEWA